MFYLLDYDFQVIEGKKKRSLRENNDKICAFCFSKGLFCFFLFDSKLFTFLIRFINFILLLKLSSTSTYSMKIISIYGDKFFLCHLMILLLLTVTYF